ncbi:TPA: hypothetical protein ACNEJJ_000556 [Escherichia coli]|uniref:CD-NTase-associated protein 15 domain-containing protein n=1 Tax=Escherichia coli TaxID=562 RepID=A0A6N8QWU1_ECOLX|nr:MULTISPECIES: hypothetical protein [Escherichia]MED0061253.1 hypothetical protein [Escherichia marmotae]EEY3955962.1 hypothetical protein [Escherichia coli]EFJ55818.1 hypothetical protein HMPREF9549_02707 [Escherichia coli MS 185-1]EFK5497444.1 hypothetical protein [Escherichia coli]EHH7568799.1 hypothetical protein [Escherichia coli]
MINLLPIWKIISRISVIYATVCGLILLGIYDENTTFMTVLSVASGGLFILNTIVISIFFFGWRKLWQWFPKLNNLLFPDLNGTWDMVIHWEWEDKKGTSHAQATIKQDFLKIGMDVEADDSDSQTLVAKPKKDTETGRPELYYVFLTTPKHKAGFGPQDPYMGTAILKLNLNDKDVLNGNYFTSRKTVGHYELTRIN